MAAPSTRFRLPVAVGFTLLFMLQASLPLGEDKVLCQGKSLRPRPLGLPWNAGPGWREPGASQEPRALPLLARVSILPGPAKAGKPRSSGEGYRPRGYYSGDPLPPSTIYLSFDDGPWDFTGDILDVPRSRGGSRPPSSSTPTTRTIPPTGTPRPTSSSAMPRPCGAWSRRVRS